MLADNAFLSGADELAALKGAFIRQDVAGHGFIRSSQIPDALMELGRDPTNAAVILREFDPDGNGPVDFEQFIRIAAASLGEFASRSTSASEGACPSR
jgi:Ca2+-binding EF-hand superfamily protein